MGLPKENGQEMIRSVSLSKALKKTGAIITCCLLAISACPVSAAADDAETLDSPDLVATRLPEGLLSGDGEPLCAHIVSTVREQSSTHAVTRSAETREFNEGAAYAALTNDGELIFFRSHEKHIYNLQERTATDIYGNTYTGIIYPNFETEAEIASSSNVPWASKKDLILSVRVAEGQGIRPFACRGWFSGCANLTDVDLAGIDTSGTTNMDSMFAGCKLLTSVDVTGFDTSNVTSMSWLFANCVKLENVDVSGFDTSKVTNMSYMFHSAKMLTSIDVSGFDTSHVTDMTRMFNVCSVLESLDVSGFDTSKVTNMFGMFCSCKKLTSLDVSSFDTSNVTNMNGMFRLCDGLTELDLSNFNTSKVTDFEDMFNLCKGLVHLDLSSFDTSSGVSFKYMFDGDSKLESLDISSFDTSAATSMAYMFHNCYCLRVISLGENFSFRGDGTLDDSNSATVNAYCPLHTSYNGKWASPTAGSTPQYTPEELRDAYDGSTMAGTYYAAVSSNTVLCDANGGTGSMTAASVLVGERYEAPACEFAREGFVFAGWNTVADGSGSAYAVGDGFVPCEDVVLYAQWIEPQIVLGISDEARLELGADGGLAAVEGGAIAFENKGNVPICVSGIRAEPAEGMSIVASPVRVGEYDLSLSSDSLPTVKLSDCVTDEFADLASPANWTIEPGAVLHVTRVEGVTAGLDYPDGASCLPIGVVQWRFAMAGD